MFEIQSYAVYNVYDYRETRYQFINVVYNIRTTNGAKEIKGVQFTLATKKPAAQNAQREIMQLISF